MGKYSKVALLGYLNQYNKSELMQKLSDYQIEKIESSETIEIIRFSGEKIRIDIAFDKQGGFIRIVEEAWESPPMIFRR